MIFQCSDFVSYKQCWNNFREFNTCIKIFKIDTTPEPTYFLNSRRFCFITPPRIHFHIFLMPICWQAWNARIRILFSWEIFHPKKMYKWQSLSFTILSLKISINDAEIILKFINVFIFNSVGFLAGNLRGYFMVEVFAGIFLMLNCFL